MNRRRFVNAIAAAAAAVGLRPTDGAVAATPAPPEPARVPWPSANPFVTNEQLLDAYPFHVEPIGDESQEFVDRIVAARVREILYGAGNAEPRGLLYGRRTMTSEMIEDARVPPAYWKKIGVDHA